MLLIHSDGLSITGDNSPQTPRHRAARLTGNVHPRPQDNTSSKDREVLVEVIMRLEVYKNSYSLFQRYRDVTKLPDT